MKFNFRKDSLILLGNTHLFSVTKHILTSNKSLEGLDVVFLGDGGEMGRDLTSFEVAFGSLNRELKARDINLFYIRGNHSHPDIWKLDWSLSNIFFVQDYDEGEFPNGKTALFIGGGISLDRSIRKKDWDYFEDEGSAQIPDNFNKRFNFVFAHDCPEEFNQPTSSLKRIWKKFVDKDSELVKDCVAQRGIMSKVCKITKPEKWFSGHFHNNCRESKNGTIYRCVDINELLEIKA